MTMFQPNSFEPSSGVHFLVDMVYLLIYLWCYFDFIMPVTVCSYLTSVLLPDPGIGFTNINYSNTILINSYIYQYHQWFIFWSLYIFTVNWF